MTFDRKEYEGISDEALIEKMRNGETAVAEYLLERYKGLVRGKARVLFLVGGETDDLIQEGMIGLYKAIRDFRPGRGASFETFARLCVDRQMATAVENSIRKKHQPLNSYVSLSEEGTDLVFPAGMGRDPEEILIDQENILALKDSIRRELSPLEMQVLDAYLEGNRVQAIAKELGRPAKSIENALRRIRTKIRNRAGGSDPV